MSKTWGNIGAWAAEAEQAEAEEKEQEAAAAAAAAAAPPQSYPSIKEAVNTNKGKKKTKMTLQEFTMASAGTSTGIGGYKGLTPEEMMRLPTGPKERSAEEMQYGRSGGGFSSYGGGRSSAGPRNRDGDGDGSWGSNRRSYGGFDDENRRGLNSRVSEFDPQPSRADEVDNWANRKKTTSFDNSSARGNRYSGLSTTTSGAFGSRADEIDNWAVNKKPVTPTRSSSFGFRDPGLPEQDRWSKGVGMPRESTVTERRRLVLDPPKGEGSVNESVSKSNKPNPFGNARPREEILAEKGLDWKKLDLEFDSKKVSSRPTSSHSNSRPGSAQSGRSGEGQGSVSAVLQGLEKPKVKVNPFGDAKPREVLVREKGVDYGKIDLELERTRLGRPETEEEMHTERPGSGAGRVGPGFQERPGSGAGRVGPGFQERSGSGAGRLGPGFQERPGSGAGRVGPGFQESPDSGPGRAGPVFQERPGFQSGSLDESRSVDFSDRRGFGGGRDRGFLGNRDLGRSNSRERW
ncbi:eukaryotic translation initiation factor 4B2-like [Rutidosis leptorrhynchoides]|uniref:eukaryotic translation initiation factor 4B2-like n=1 Tax=Rutidosis leptorrhynchoides TaxID=125765 RepID=UPI003A98DA9C